MRWLSVIAALACALALPLVIVMGVVRFAFAWQPIYTYAVTAYHPEDATGVPAPELLRATGIIRSYFSNRQPDLDVTVTDAAGDQESLFNAREVAHMRDVKALVQRLDTLALVSAAVLVVGAAVICAVGRPRLLAKALLAGSVLTTAVLIAFGIAASAGFDQLFLQFHLLSFSNSNWELDPLRDHLIQLFPEGYWLSVSMFVSLLSLGIAVALAALSTAYLLATRKPRSI